MDELAELDGVVEEIAVDAAPVDSETEELETEETETPEVIEKTFTQAELDDIVTKRLAREKRKTERVPAVTEDKAETLDASQFDSVDDFIEALAEKKIADRDAKKTRETEFSAYREREEEARDRHADFQEVAYNPNLKITDTMAQAIRSSETGPDVAYYLGQNPKEAARISKLAPMAQYMAIGRLEGSLTSPAKPKLSQTPTPIAPIGGRKGKTDKTPADMTDTEYAAWRRSRKG